MTKFAQYSEEHNLLATIDRALNSSKMWNGMDWTYLPIHPINYRKAREMLADYLNKWSKEIEETKET